MLTYLSNYLTSVSLQCIFWYLYNVELLIDSALANAMIVVPNYSCQTADDCVVVAGQLAYCYKNKCICLRGALIKDGQCTELLTCLKVCLFVSLFVHTRSL